ncbi:MAG: PAS domain-containing protein [Planctomycetota bacterium]|jgi:PAS domain S-box-containing protein
MNEKVSGHPESQRSNYPLLWIYLLIGLVAAVMLGSMVFVFYVCNHMVAEHAPLVDAAIEIKFEATAGHLAFEEMISGDRAENIEDVLKHIDQAIWYAQAMLEGGQSAEGRILPLEEARLRRAITEVRDKLTEFRKITEQRWRQRDTAEISAEIDRQDNAVYDNFIAQADLVETQLQRIIKKELTLFRIMQTISIAVCLFVTAVVGVVFGRFVRKRIRDELALRAANQQLADSEQELRREKDKVRRYLDVAAVMIVAVDCEQRVDLINKKGCEILGYDESDILGRNWFDCFLPEKLRDQARTAFESLIAGEVEPIEYYENPVLAKDGSERLILWHDTVLRNDEGRIICTLSSGEDITERKQTEEELRQYEHIVSTSSDMLALLDKSFTYIAANEAYLKAFKLTREQLIGHTVSEVFGEESFAEVIKPNAERCLAGQEVNYQTWFDFPAYEPRYMDITYYPYRGRERAEEQLRQKDYIIESSSSAIATSNLDGDIIYGNPAFLDMWGFDHPDEFLGKHFTEYWMVAEQVDKIMDTLQTEGKWTDEIKARRKDGSVFDVQVLASIVHDREGNPVSVMSSSVDITERKQAEEALRESEERFRSLSESSPVGIFHTDEQGAVLYTNPQWQRITGLSLEESLGFGWARAIHPDDKDRILGLWDECLREEKGYSGEFRFLASSGQVKWVYTSTSPIRSARGDVVGHVGMNQDITEQKQAELAIHRSEQKYRSLVANIPDVVWTTDQTGRTTFIGSNVKRVYGYTPEEIYQEGEQLWFGRIHPDDVDTVKQSYEAVFEKGVQLDIEYRIRRKDGEWIWLRDRSIGAYEIDGVKYADGVFFDITELKRAEAERVRLTDILETTSDLVSTATPDRELTYLNRAGKRMLGWPEDESCTGREIPDVHPDWAFDVIKNEGIPTAIEQGVWQGETALLRSDGAEIPVSQVIMAHKSPTGQVEYFSTIMRDITERKQIEQAIRRSEEQLSLIYNTTTNGMVLIGIEPEGEFRIVSHNQAFDRLVAEGGIEQGAPDGISVEKFFRETLRLSPEDVAYRLDKQREAARTRKVVRFERVTNLPNVGEVVHYTTLHPVVTRLP